MSEGQKYLIALFLSVSHVMRAEKILMEKGIPHKLIPVPKKISSECGVCLRFLPEQRDDTVKALGPEAGIVEIRDL
jgi:hypothetical protein